MVNNKSLINKRKVEILPNLTIKIPTVDEVLSDEQLYYETASVLVLSPYQYMVQLDDAGIDFSSISDYELFLMLFPIFAQGDLSAVFGDIDTKDFKAFEGENGKKFLRSESNNITIDELVYNDIANTIRKIYMFEKESYKAGNEHARKYLLDKERRKLKRLKNKKYEPQFEKLVIALVNTKEFPYDYESCMKLSLYQFNQSLKQVGHKINFDNTMIGVYSGTIDASKMGNKDSLIWIQK